MKNHVVEVKDIKKSFLIPKHGSDSIKDSFVNLFTKKEKGFEKYNALNGITFNVEKGDFFGVLGRNGSGKSTLLKIISEIYQPSSGSVKHKGRVVSFIELGVGFRPQLSGRENVYLNGGLLGFSTKEIDAMYDDIVAFAELEEFMEQKLKNYSSGMKVRLAFSVAIRADADILILDEVLAVGDASFQQKCYDYFKSLKDSHKTVILVTHSMSAVRTYCNKAIVIENGVVEFEGSAEDAAEKYLDLFAKDSSKTEEDYKTSIAQFKTISANHGAQKSLNASNAVTLDISIDVKEKLKDPVLAFSIRNSTDKVIVASNTKVLKYPLGTRTPGVYTFRIAIDNIFANGQYRIFSTLFDNQMDQIYCRSFGKETFNVHGRDNSVARALVHPSITIKTEE